MTTVPDRIRWAVEVVDPAPAQDILEVGCGPGVAAALVCERLTTGRMLAVDRSPVAVARTLARNATHVESGRLAVRQSELDTLDVSSVADKAFTVNVNVFWTRDAGRELAALRHALRVGGRLYVLYGGGPTGADRVTPVIGAALAAHGFTDVTVLRAPHGLGVAARRAA
ncbi:MAG TPA: class I SAM-dependent methyltransferase [Actinophytocola sp.]|nr:class I SAM-dependent methyltransferase [Actinophytocola sp.]